MVVLRKHSHSHSHTHSHPHPHPHPHSTHARTPSHAPASRRKKWWRAWRPSGWRDPSRHVDCLWQMQLFGARMRLRLRLCKDKSSSFQGKMEGAGKFNTVPHRTYTMWVHYRPDRPFHSPFPALHLGIRPPLCDSRFTPLNSPQAPEACCAKREVSSPVVRDSLRTRLCLNCGIPALKAKPATWLWDLVVTVCKYEVPHAPWLPTVLTISRPETVCDSGCRSASQSLSPSWVQARRV